MLRPFSFPLEQVRSLRAHVEAAAKAALAQELAAKAERQAELRDADEAVASARGGTISGRPLTGAELAARQAFLERRERERAAAEVAARAREQLVLGRIAQLVGPAAPTVTTSAAAPAATTDFGQVLQQATSSDTSEPATL
jgi:hypothetical protein